MGVPRLTLHNGSHNKFWDYPLVSLWHSTGPIVIQLTKLPHLTSSTSARPTLVIVWCACVSAREDVLTHIILGLAQPQKLGTLNVWCQVCQWSVGWVDVSARSLYLTYQSGIAAKRSRMPKHTTCPRLFYAFRSVTCVLRKMCVKLANEGDIFVYSTVFTSICFHPRNARRILMKFDTNVTCLKATPSSHFLNSYDRSHGVPTRILATITTELSQQVPLKRWYLSTKVTVTQLYSYRRQNLTPYVILL
jgi:hypothetical protein